MPGSEIIGTFFGVITILAGGVSALLYANSRMLRDSRDDLEKRVAFLESERQRDGETIHRQEAAIEVLRKSMTGEVHLVALSDLAEHISKDLNDHHQETTAKWEKTSATLGEISATMVAMKSALERLSAA